MSMFMYGKVMFPALTVKTVTGVLMRRMLCCRERSSAGDGRTSVLVNGRAATLAESSM